MTEAKKEQEKQKQDQKQNQDQNRMQNRKRNQNQNQKQNRDQEQIQNRNQQKDKNKEEYIIETHCHTSETSSCGKMPAVEVVELHIKEGYSGIIVTDHMNLSFNGINTDSWTEKIDNYLRGYRAAREAAGKNLDVFLGMELRFTGLANDFLVYGLTEEILYKYNTEESNFMNMSVEGFKKFAGEHGLLIFLAHPFRNHMEIIDPSLVDGIETFNGANDGHQTFRNILADMWADEYGLKKISGSDFHHTSHLGKGGIITKERIKDSDKLMEILRSGDYDLKTTSNHRNFYLNNSTR